MLFSFNPPEILLLPSLDFKKRVQTAAIAPTKKTFWPIDRPSTEPVALTAAAANPETLALVEEAATSAMLATSSLTVVAVTSSSSSGSAASATPYKA
jgi:hypothetical protein